MFQLSDIRKSKVFQEALEEGLKKGREEGREEGREVGREEGREEVARRLLSENYTIEKIAALTGLSLNQVKKLRRRGNP